MRFVVVFWASQFHVQHYSETLLWDQSSCMNVVYGTRTTRKITPLFKDRSEKLHALSHDIATD